MTRAGKPKLLSGGNPQIPKGEGDGPVQAYLSALPGWKRAVGRALDAAIVEAVPEVQKAVKWNSPFYGVKQGCWFASFHAFDRYLKVTFFQGDSLEPKPPETSKYPAVRYYHVHEGEMPGEEFAEWVRQAARLPGEKM